MKNLKSRLITGAKFGVGVLAGMIIIGNIETYYLCKAEIAKEERLKGCLKAEEHSKQFIKDYDNCSLPLGLFFHGAYDASQEYLIKNLDNNKQNENH